MMKIFFDRLFCFSICTSCVLGVYIKDEEPSTKPPLQVEELPWLSFFDRKSSSSSLNDEKEGRTGRSHTERTNLDLISHSTLCPPGETGQFPYPPDCKRFINCWKGRGSIQVCAPGTLFNSETFECDFPGKVKCDDKLVGLMPMATGGRYIRFSHQRPEIAHNPRIPRKNQNELLKADALAVNSPHIDSFRLLPSPRPGNQNEEKGFRASCARGATGLYPHPYDCAKFLKCWSGNTYVQNCGPGTFFNPLISACDHPRNVPCAYEGDFQLAQTALGKAEILGEDIQVPEESVHYDKLQDMSLSLKIPITKDTKTMIRKAHDSAMKSSNSESNIDAATSATPFHEQNNLTHSKLKIINVGNFQEKNQYEKDGKMPASYLAPPLYGPYGTTVTSNETKNETSAVSYGQFEYFNTNNSHDLKVYSQNSSVYPSDSFLINYPPEGSYLTTQLNSQQNLNKTKNYFAHIFNKEHSHREHPGYPHHYHFQHPHFLLNYPIAQSPHNHFHNDNPSRLIPPSFQAQFFPHYAPYHPFSLKAGSYNSPEIPFETSVNVPKHLKHIPYNPTYYSEENKCPPSKEIDLRSPSLPKCEQESSVYDPKNSFNPYSFRQGERNKPNLLPTYISPAPPLFSGSSATNPVLQKPSAGHPQVDPNLDEKSSSAYSDTDQLNATPSEKKIESLYTSKQQFDPTHNRSQFFQNSHDYSEISYELPPVNLGMVHSSSPSSNAYRTNQLYKPNLIQPLHYPQVPKNYSKQQQYSSNYNLGYPTVQYQNNYYDSKQSEEKQEIFRAGFSEKPNSSDRSRHNSLPNPQLQSYLFYYYPVNRNLYSHLSTGYTSNQNARPQTPFNNLIFPTTSDIQKTFIPNPISSANVIMGPQNKPGPNAAYLYPNEGLTQHAFFDEAPDSYSLNNYVSKDYNSQLNKDYPEAANKFYPKEQDDRIYGAQKISLRPEHDSNIITGEPQLKVTTPFPPFPGSTGKFKGKNVSNNIKEGANLKNESPDEYLLDHIDVRTEVGDDDSPEDVDKILTTQIPHGRSGGGKVEEIYEKENNKKLLNTLPDRYSQLKETSGSRKENEKDKLKPKTEEKQNPEQFTTGTLKLEFDVNGHQKPKKQFKKPYVKVKQTPPNGQTVRLRNGTGHLDGYLEMKSSKAKWGLICDQSGQWGIAEATVACRELGFIRGAELFWQGYPIRSESEELHVSANGIICKGTETSILECEITDNDKKLCDVGRNAVGLRCFDNLASHCQPGEILYSQHCYKLHEKDNPDDPWIKTEEASEQCKKYGGKLVDITSQYENDFISEWLIKKHPDVTVVATGGIGISVLGRPMWLWEGTSDPMIYERWWSGWSGDQDIPRGSIDSPLCIVLRKTFSCADNNDLQKASESVKDEDTCSADYFFWDVEECAKLRTSTFICERPMDDIGCVIGNGEAYVGTANTTASGSPCLPWDHPKAIEGLARRGSAQEKSSRLSGHNYCRNLGNPDRHPWCFVEGRGNSEYCAIPQCWANSVSGSYFRSSVRWSSCDITNFECEPGECVKKEWVCDGRRDCTNGRDEETCKIFLQEFTKNVNKRLKIKANESWPKVSETICAKMCLDSKHFKCRSFSFSVKNRDCLLSELNAGLSGQVVNAKGWIYYERSSESLKCTIENGFFECENGKCVNISNVCDGKKNCEDGSDERNCALLGYKIQLAGSTEKHKGRIEVKSKWGVVCDDMFDMRDATVVCRELGFKLGPAEVLKHSEFPVENPLFLVDRLDCLGNETTIRECPFPGWGKHNCGPEEIVGVSCRVPGIECPEGQWHCKKSKECISLAYLCDGLEDCGDGSDEHKPMCESPTQIRLSGGPNVTSGRLEIRHYNIWGTVCHDDFSFEAGQSVCSILGFDGPSIVKKSAYFGTGKGPIWLDSGLCFINETNLDECTKIMAFQNNCKHDEDVSIICSQQEFHQKSSAVKPIASSSTNYDIGNVEEKLRQRLISECNNKSQVKFQPHLEKLEKVVGGSTVVREALPWQASIRVRSGSGKSVHWCGAVIISPYHVLTAGHCLRDYNKAAYFIRVGDYDTNVVDPNEQDFGIEQLFMHSNFSKNIYLNNDIGLVKVKGEIPLGHAIRPACLAPSIDIYHPGTNCSVSGWGSVSAASAGYARTLRRAFVPILDQSVCRASYVYGENLSDGMFCAGLLDGGVDSCQGDSGGPLMCQYEGKEYLFGITSWGHGCGRANKPGVYTNVAFYTTWIQQKIKTSL